MIEYLVEGLAVYYGMDYVAMIFVLLGMYLLTIKNRWGFAAFLIGSIAWIVVNVIAGIFAGIVLNAIMIVLNIKGFMEWKKD